MQFLIKTYPAGQGGQIEIRRGVAGLSLHYITSDKGKRDITLNYLNGDLEALEKELETAEYDIEQLLKSDSAPMPLMITYHCRKAGKGNLPNCSVH